MSILVIVEAVPAQQRATKRALTADKRSKAVVTLERIKRNNLAIFRQYLLGQQGRNKRSFQHEILERNCWCRQGRTTTSEPSCQK